MPGVSVPADDALPGITGNVFFDWQGCPPEQLAKLGVGGR